VIPALLGPGAWMRAGVFLLAAPALAEMPPDLPEGDREAGRKASMQCRTCHGSDGYAKIPIAPHIGGEPAGYIAAQLAAFRDGAREHEMMSIVAQSLSDQQIADLAAWYAGHEISVTLAADPAEAPQTCTACHGPDGVGLTEDVPNLAGEANIYIDTQLKAFRSGKRTHEIMSAIAADMSDADIRAAADWYAAVGLEITEVAAD
jgi:cytochrome c553